jgi:hypothetical protein
MEAASEAEQAAKAAAKAASKKPKLHRTTLRRLTAIPSHKMRQDHRHFPIVAPPPGSYGQIQMHGMDELLQLQQKRPDARKAADSDDDDERPAAAVDANERRKQFLTMSNLKRVFKELDLAEDGYIDVDELYEAQRKIGGRLSRAEVRDVMWEVDDNRTGRLTMDEYLTAYRRSQADESGFEPKRFYSIVEFLLMDRDSSGEISLDEAMTTIFERQGVRDLERVTRSFFEAAGVADGVTEPPPGTTVSFMGYYHKVGCAKPHVPCKGDLSRSWSDRLRVEEGRQLPPRPKVNRSASACILPTLREAERMAKLAASRAPRELGVSLSPSASRSQLQSRAGGRADAGQPRRPATSPAASAHHGPGMFKRGQTGMAVLNGLKQSPPSALEPLDERRPDSSHLSTSALRSHGGERLGRRSRSVKERAATMLGLDERGDASAGALPDFA